MRSLRTMVQRILFLMLTWVCLTTALHADITIGVLVNNSKEVTAATWEHLATDFDNILPGITCHILPLDFDEVDDAIATKKVHLVLLNPALYLEMHARYDVTCLATLKRLYAGTSVTKYGSVILTRADRSELTDLPSLTGCNLAAVSPNSFGGWKIVLSEFYAKNLNPENVLASITFLNEHDAVVFAVRDGKADVGVVRTGTLERLIAQKQITLNTFRILHPRQTQGFPLIHSSALYPEWALAALPGISPEACEKITAGLFTLPPYSPSNTAFERHAWSIPQDYHPVAEACQYNAYCKRNDSHSPLVPHMIQQHQSILLCMGVLLFGSLFMAFWSIRLYRRMRKISIHLEKELAKSTAIEHEIRNRESKLKSIFRAAPVGIGVIHDRVFNEVNDHFCSMLGYSTDELLGRSSRIIYPDEATFLAIGAEKIHQIETTGHCSLETRFRHADGHSIDVLLNMTPLNPANPSEGTTFIAQNITERKMATKALEESEHRLSQLFHNMHSGAAVYRAVQDGQDFVIVDLNSAAEHLSHVRLDEVRDRCVSEVFPGIGPMGLLDVFRRVWKTGEAERLELTQYKDDRFSEWVENTVYRLPDGQIVALYEDTSEKHEAIDALSKSELRYRTIFETVQDGMCIFLGKDLLESANPAACRMFGRTEQALCAMNPHELLHPDSHAFFDSCFDLIGIQPNITGEIKGLCASGDIFNARLTGTALSLGDQQGFIAILHDCTDENRMREQIHQTEKMDAIGQLAGGIAHDYNNQLAGIMGYAEMLGYRLQDESLRKYIEHITSIAGRSAELTQQLLAFARKGQVQRVPVDIHTVISEVTTFLEHTIDKRIIITKELSADHPIVTGDHSQLENAFLNICLNARDAMSEGGVLTLSTKQTFLDDDFCQTHPYQVSPGKYVEINISDTGVGMPRSTLAHIFEPFFTTKPEGKGTGMGLAATYGTIKSHGGAITVYSEEQHGTTFRIFLPQDMSSVLTEAPEANTLLCGTGRILLIDDEDTIRTMTAELLSLSGFEVTTCSDGKEALDTFAASHGNFDLVILDMIMPRMSGKETFHGLRKINPDVRILLASGYSLNDEAQEVLTEGACGYIQKPFMQHALVRKITDILNR